MLEIIWKLSVFLCLVGTSVLLWQIWTRLAEIEQHLRVDDWKPQQREYSE